MRQHERGFTLIEAAAATAIASLGVAALIFGASTLARFGAHHTPARREAALAFARRIARTAQNVWKYGSPGDAPSGTASSAAGTATVSIASSGTGAMLRVVVRYTPDPGDNGSVMFDAPLRVRAPFPGETLTRPGLVPAPAGAP